MKLILSTLFFGLIATQANAAPSNLTKLEDAHVTEIISCPFHNQSKVNKDASRELAASLTKKKTEKEVKQKVAK